MMHLISVDIGLIYIIIRECCEADIDITKTKRNMLWNTSCGCTLSRLNVFCGALSCPSLCFCAFLSSFKTLFCLSNGQTDVMSPIDLASPPSSLHFILSWNYFDFGCSRGFKELPNSSAFLQSYIFIFEQCICLISPSTYTKPRL